MLRLSAIHCESIIAQSLPNEAADVAVSGGADSAHTLAAPDQVAGLRLQVRPRRTPLVLIERPRWWLLAAAVVLHVLFGLLLRNALPVPPQAQNTAALRVRFVPILLEASPTAPPPPVVLPETRRSPSASVTRTPVHTTTHTPVTAAANTPDVQLYDHDGQPLLPARAASSSATPDYVQHLPQGDTRIMHNVDPVHYRATRFEQYFPPPGESAGGALVRHVVSAVVKSKDIDLPHGVHLKCMTVLGIPTPNCAMPPAAPSAKDGDERLSMAPAKPLAAGVGVLPAPSVAACIAMYRAGKPLESGCPTDTPSRAVGDELRQRAASAGGHH